MKLIKLNSVSSGTANKERSTLLLIFCFSLLSGCVIIRSEQAEKRLRETVLALPKPERVVFVDEISGVGGGSDPECYTAYISVLYGTDQTAEEIRRFYTDALLSLGDWEEIAERSSDQHLTFENRKDGFQLSLLHDLTYDAVLSETSITDAQRKFDAPFIIAAAHADSSTRKKCWPGWEQ